MMSFFFAKMRTILSVCCYFNELIHRCKLFVRFFGIGDPTEVFNLLCEFIVHMCKSNLNVTTLVDRV